MASPANSLIVDDTGNVGIGTALPNVPIHVLRDPVAATNQTLFKIENKGGTRFDIRNSNTNTLWFFQNDQDSTYKISRLGTGGSEIILRQRGDAGGLATMTLDGSLEASNVVFSSSRELKTDFGSIDQAHVLEQVLGLPIQHWRLKTESSSARHIGPMAEDFQAAFALGDGKHISVSDAHGIAFAAIQGLKAEKDREIETLRSEKDRELAALRKSNADLTKRLAKLEHMMTTLVTPNQAVALTIQ
ncbi:MAG: tail fiber domain-containing protein [Gammaproteobacteria bacterium]|nr:tail fiber domain-containing protein [Gammaproteobacteria bacterium]